MGEGKKLKKARKWAMAEGCETGEAMGNIISVIRHFPDYLSDEVRGHLVDAVTLMQKELEDDFKINEDGEMEAK